MGERKSTNKYYPLEWTPEQGSLNKYHNHHPLGDRARKIKQGIIVIRFELPWDVWCGKCNDLLPRGRRFNAEKQKVGNYMSTPIFSFKIRCNKCANWIIMQVDPENSDFLVTHGGRRRIKESNNDEAFQNLPKIMTQEERQEMRSDIFSMLEHSREELDTVMSRRPKLTKIQNICQNQDNDAVINNRKLRDKFRVKRKEVEALEKEADSRGLAIKLLPTSSDDEVTAKELVRENLVSGKSFFKTNSCVGRSIFSDKTVSNKLLIHKINSLPANSSGVKKILVRHNDEEKQVFGPVAKIVFQKNTVN